MPGPAKLNAPLPPPQDPGAPSLRLLMINPTVEGKPDHVHIGLGTVATYVHRNSAHAVRCLDFAQYRRNWRRRLARVMSEFEPDVVAFYLSTPYFPVARGVADEVRRLSPRATIVGGGHHATFEPERTLAHPAFDVAIRGEGELSMVALLDALEADAGLQDVPGLVWRDGEQQRENPRAAVLAPENITGVDWSLHDEETLRRSMAIWGVLPVMASRGCPADCSFCAISKMQRLYRGEAFLRFRDPIDVVDEIESQYRRYKRWGMRMVFFYDLNFLVNPKWARELTDEYRRRGLHRELKFTALTRADHITDDTLDLLRDSGCVNLKIGVESANPTMRNDIYNKELPQDVLETALRRIKELGISVTAYFIAGGPGERPEWLMESLEFARRTGIEYPVWFLYKPLPGTDILKRAGSLGSYVLDDRMESQSDFLHGVDMKHEHITTRQLEWFMKTSQAMIAPRILKRQLRREGPMWFVNGARYVARCLALGFPAYLSASFYIFYAHDHVSEPMQLPSDRSRGPMWRAAMAATRTWLR